MEYKDLLLCAQHVKKYFSLLSVWRSDSLSNILQIEFRRNK